MVPKTAIIFVKNIFFKILTDSTKTHNLKKKLNIFGIIG